MSELEIELTAIMVKIMLSYPDGVERILSSLESVLDTHIEMKNEFPHNQPKNHLMH